MKNEFLDSNANWNQSLLCVTHSDRITELERCDLNFLESRYANQHRLPPNIPFEFLTNISEHQPYNGTVTIWEFVQNDFSKPRLICFLRPGYKPQHALWYQGKLWILGVDRLEVYNLMKDESPTMKLVHEKTIEDPWLSGAHTVFPDNRGHLLISCAGSDSVLLVDEQALKVVDAFRLPESIYGRNFPLSRADSVVEHYVPNDLQLTHVNCAYPWRGGIAVSTLLGAIGWFDFAGHYKELFRGFVGCHGIRAQKHTGNSYFCDSCVGTVDFLDENCVIRRRISTGSRWLHDAQELANNIIAVSVTDRNQVELIDTFSGKVLTVISGEGYGMGPQFLYFGR